MHVDGEDFIAEDENAVASSLFEGEANVIKLIEVSEVDEKEPAPTMSLAQANNKDSSERLFFASENCIFTIHVCTSRSADYVSMADTLRFTIIRRNEATALAKHRF